MAKDDPTLTQDPFSEAEQPQLPVAQTPFERMNTGSGIPMIDAAVQRDFQQRQAQANLYKKNAADINGLLFHLADPEARKSYLNPQTGQPYTDDDIQQLQMQVQHATGQYEKLVGVDKESKNALQKARGIIDFIRGKRREAMQPPPTPDYPTTVGDAGVTTSGVNTPRQGPVATPSSYATNVSDTGGVQYNPAVANQITPPPLSPRQEAIRASMQLPFATHQGKVEQLGLDENTLQRMGAQGRRALVQQMDMDEKKPYIQDFILTGKITGNMAASLRPPPRPAGSYTTSVLDARKRAANGEVFRNIAGEILDPADFDPSMGFKGMQTLNPETSQWEIRYEPFSPNQATVTAGNQIVAVNPADKSKIPEGAGTVLGPHNVETTTKTRDPATGQTTVSTKTPQTPGIVGRPGGTPLPPTPGGAAPSVGQVSKAQKQGGVGGVGKAAQIPTASVPALDESGHIPATAAIGLTPQVVEGANQLLDGKDVKDIPAKTKELSASLARKYGWEQGKFTPREQGALRNATQFIDDMLSDPATFAVLDNTLSRLKLNQVMAGTEKQGALASTMTTLAASNMTDQEAKFIRQYNIITQTLAGIAPAIRGSGNRTTEAAIHRLLSDMPNPKTTQSAKDGIERLQLLKKEVARALAKGQFTEAQAAAPSGARMTPPPSASGRPPLSSFEH